MSIRVEVDDDVCVSSGRCVADAPEAFEFDADEISHPTAAAGALSRAHLLEIARGCPSGAIRLFDDTGEIALY